MAAGSKLRQIAPPATTTQTGCTLLLSHLSTADVSYRLTHVFFLQWGSLNSSVSALYLSPLFHKALKEKNTHSTVRISFFFLFCLPQPPLTLIINIVSDYLSWWQALRNSCTVKKTQKKYSCFYKYLLSLFIDILQILSSKQASSFIICQP